MKVLIVDSDSTTLKTLETAFATRGFVVLTAETCIEAWNKLIDHARSKKMPDLIILEPIGGEGMDGIELIRRMRTMTGFVATPVIVVSADQELIDRSILAGATAGFAKPMSIDQITKLSKRLLADRQSSATDHSAIGYTTGPMSF